MEEMQERDTPTSYLFTVKSAYFLQHEPRRDVEEPHESWQQMSTLPLDVFSMWAPRATQSNYSHALTGGPGTGCVRGGEGSAGVSDARVYLYI
jgi:hypothetical protein